MAIVTTNVSTQVAPAPSALQRTGAIISTGGTTLADGAKSLLTQASDLTALLAGAVAVTAGSTTWSGGTVTMTTATAHGFTTGDSVTVSGFTAGYTGYNGTYTITVVDSTSFTYAQADTLTSPASGTAVVTDADVAELTAAVNTFFTQGSSVSVYVLELGHGTAADGVAALGAYITANPGTIYSYLVPRSFAAEATYVTLVGGYDSSTSKTYFHTTVTLSTYASFANKKAVLMTIEAATAPVTEFTAAAAFWVTLHYDPNPTNQVTPLCFAYVSGVTAYPITATTAATFATANLNYVTTGAEGGISNTMFVNGVTADGQPFNYWYSVDWVQINADLRISAAVINGSNNPQAPLYYDQQGINRLEGVVQGLGSSAVSDGLAIGPVYAYALTAADWTAFLQSGNAPVGFLVNAVPFVSYTTLNPGDYTIGKYGGLSCSYTPARGFQSIVFNINVSSFPLV